MRLYLAAQWVERDQLPAVAAQFESAGFTITERWWEHADVAGYPLDVTPADFDELGEQATKDFMGVVNADVLVLLNTGKSEGKAVETGVAIAMFKPVLLIGARSNIFHFLPNVHQVVDVAGAVELLRS